MNETTDCQRWQGMVFQGLLDQLNIHLYVGIKAGIHYPKDHIERMVDNRLSKIAMDDISKFSRIPGSSSIRWY